MPNARKYPLELIERGVRLALESADHHYVRTRGATSWSKATFTAGLQMIGLIWIQAAAISQ